MRGACLPALRRYTELCGLVPDDLLARHAHVALRGSSEALWAAKRSAASQLAASAILGHALTVGDRSPARFALHLFSSGGSAPRFTALDFRPVYQPEGQLEPLEDVPFRLTRNVMTFLSPLLVDGVFASTMAATALAVKNNAPTSL